MNQPRMLTYKDGQAWKDLVQSLIDTTKNELLEFDSDGKINKRRMLRAVCGVFRKIEIENVPNNDIKEFKRTAVGGVIHYCWWLHSKGDKMISTREIVDILLDLCMMDNPIALRS